MASASSDGPRPRHDIAVLGGTGPHGRGLALRLAAAGHRIVVGSRDAQRAAAAADELRATLPGGNFAGAANDAAAARAQVVILAVPYEGVAQLLPPLRSAIGDKVVISCINPLRFDRQGPVPVRLEEGSAAQQCQQLLPDARVVSAFQNVSSVKLAKLTATLSDHVLVCGDDDDAKQVVADLVRDIADLQPLDAGPLRLSGPVEDLTAVILSVNRRYKVNAGVALTGLRRAAPAAV